MQEPRAISWERRAANDGKVMQVSHTEAHGAEQGKKKGMFMKSTIAKEYEGTYRKETVLFTIFSNFLVGNGRWFGGILGVRSDGA